MGDMYFQQFYLGCLSHASYVIGSEGVAAVVDPQRDVGIYIEDAVKHGLRIEHVIETHLHADFISGHAELAALTGATIYLGAQAGAKFPHVPVRDGDEVRFGKCILRFLETPGHTLESISILVTDTERSPEPFAVLTGDTLFIGDVGRPDLSPNHTPQQLAGLLYDSLHNKLLTLPDAVEVYPAHGAGSLCGRQMSAERSSTIGAAAHRQLRAAGQIAGRIRSPADQRTSRAARLLRAGCGAEPVRSHAAGRSSGARWPDARKDVAAQQAAGALVLDTRPAGQFGGGHIPGAMHIALSGQFASWAGRLIGLDRRVILVAEDRDAMLEAFTRLARVGMEHVDRISGRRHDGVVPRRVCRWTQVPQVTVQDLHREMEHVQVIDVRQPGEWEQRHIAQARAQAAAQADRDAGRRRPGAAGRRALQVAGIAVRSPAAC